MTKKTFTLGALAAGAIWLGVRWANSAASTEAGGLSDGRLAACPDKPNCVSSQSDKQDSRMEPIPLRGSAAKAQARLRNIIESMPRGRIVDSGDGYLRAEFRSLLMGFVDDVEFAIDASAGVVDFRSASRIGYSDLGVNRKRMEEIRRRYEAAE